jgi:hypothetical protein
MGSLTHSSSPNAQLSSSVTKKRKTIDIYEEMAYKNEQMLAKSLQIQTEGHQLQKNRAAIAEKQLVVFQAAVRMEGMSTWMGKVKDLTKEYKLLKKKFQNHCGRNSDGEKQNWRARRKAHEMRVKQRGDNFGSDSSDSEESQATLLDELEQVQSELLLAKNELQLLEVSVPKEDTPVPANGNE